MFKRVGFIGLALCAVCCALPFSGIALWAGGFAIFYQYFESAAIATLVLTLIFLEWRISEKRKRHLHVILIARAAHKNSMNNKKIIL
jgi:hypothetical protein